LDNLEELIKECHTTSKEKGFPLEDHFTQILLIASECYEALSECEIEFDEKGNLEGKEVYSEVFTNFVKSMKTLCNKRKTIECPLKASIFNRNKYLEEIADIYIRLMSYTGEICDSSEIIEIINKKMEYNKTRPYKHGRKF
jgi:hypothetical protein